MKVQYYTAVSLDGYIADENHSLDWLFQFDADKESTYPEFIKNVGALAMGSSTYEYILKNYIYQGPNNPKDWPHREPTYVFTSRQFDPLPDANIHFVKGDVRPVYDKMKQAAEGKNIWIAGGGGLAAQFYEAGLLNELMLTLTPVILGKGASLFEGKIISPPLQATHVKLQDCGLIELNFYIPQTNSFFEE